MIVDIYTCICTLPEPGNVVAIHLQMEANPPFICRPLLIILVSL